MNGSADVLRHNIATVQQGTSHVLSFAWIADDHLITFFKAREGHICYRVLLVAGLIRRKDRRVCGQWEMNTGEAICKKSDKVITVRVEASGGGVDDLKNSRHQVGLELVQIHVQAPVETERGCDARDDLCDQPVQVSESWGLDIEFFLADGIDSLIVDHERAIGVLQSSVSGQDRVVGLNNGCGGLRGRVNAELELALLAIVCG